MAIYEWFDDNLYKQLPRASTSTKREHKYYPMLNENRLFLST